MWIEVGHFAVLLALLLTLLGMGSGFASAETTRHLPGLAFAHCGASGFWANFDRLCIVDIRISGR